MDEQTKQRNYNDILKNMGDTQRITKLREGYVTVDQVIKMMEAEEAVAEAPTYTPTVIAADKIGISIPSKEEKPIDPNTALPRKKPELLPGVLDAGDDEEADKKSKFREETRAMLRRRKAENRAAAINKAIDSKIQMIKEDNFQKSQIIAQINAEHVKTMEEEAQKVIEMRAREKDKRPDLNGDVWTASMPVHWQTQEKDEASSLIQNATNTATVVAVNEATKAGVLVNKAIESTA